jgi:hypothetical protein
MAFDPELVAETQAWFAKAFNDLSAAEALIAASPPLFDEAVFHCQQAAEKALKGGFRLRPFGSMGIMAESFCLVPSLACHMVICDLLRVKQALKPIIYCSH